MQIIAVNVMQMDDVRIIFAYPVEKPGGGKTAAEAGGVKGAGFEPVEFHAALASDSNRKAAVGIGNLLSSIGDPDFMAHLFQGQSKIRTDSPRAADPADRIDH